MLKVITLFTGIGAQEAALKRLGLDFEVVGISEIDKFAIQSYEAINGPTRNYGDITQIPYLDYADLWTYSSPCQDFSTAGKQKGIYNADGSLTRSGLLKHVERLLETSVMLGNQPKYLLMENVKGLVSKKFKPDFLNWLNKLESLGYNNYWQVLNAKDYGVPQNRERVFVVSIRKDIDIKGYTFPAPVPLEKRLKDMLEPCVDEKYYLSEDKVAKFLQNGNTNPSGKGINGNVCTGDICNTLTTNKGEGLKIKEVSKTIRCGGRANLDNKHTWDLLCVSSRGRNPENPSDRTVGIPTEQMLEVNTSGCSNTLTTVQKNNLILESQVLTGKRKINFKIQSNGNIRGYQNDYKKSSASEWKIHNVENIGDTLTASRPLNIIIGSTQKNAYIGSTDNISSCLTEAMGMGGGQIPKIVEQYRIRKLTPKECWRLMGFTDIEFECAQISGVSNSQLYRQAGNSIVVDVLVAIFKELLK